MPKKSKDPLQVIPGIGKAMAGDLRDLGYTGTKQLKNADPEEMYARLERLHGKQDRCVLYVFRCAVYFCSNTKHDPELLKWWNWMDKP